MARSDLVNTTQEESIETDLPGKLVIPEQSADVILLQSFFSNLLNIE